ncbi:hypothetical protein ACFLY8_01115 [Halobacteriota archaeon]
MKIEMARWTISMNDYDNYKIRYNRGDGHFEDFVEIYPEHMIELVELLKEYEPKIKKHIADEKGGVH